MSPIHARNIFTQGFFSRVLARALGWSQGGAQLPAKLFRKWCRVSFGSLVVQLEECAELHAIRVRCKFVNPRAVARRADAICTQVCQAPPSSPLFLVYLSLPAAFSLLPPLPFLLLLFPPSSAHLFPPASPSLLFVSLSPQVCEATANLGLSTVCLLPVAASAGRPAVWVPLAVADRCCERNTPVLVGDSGTMQPPQELFHRLWLPPSRMLPRYDLFLSYRWGDFDKVTLP
jgi:hypothetical protein